MIGELESQNVRIEKTGQVRNRIYVFEKISGIIQRLTLLPPFLKSHNIHLEITQVVCVIPGLQKPVT